MTKHIPLTRGKVALVDDEDYGFLMQWKWRYQAHGTGYAIRKHGQGLMSMHRQLITPPPGMCIDHISGDGLDNRRANLRVVTFRENMWNRRRGAGGTSQFKGVYWRKDRNKWSATIAAGAASNGRAMTKHLGYFIEETDAARAYDAAAREHFGPFARLNFPNENEQAA